jgi:peptidoglycan/LPS O-acetylase OafA/YrhL
MIAYHQTMIAPPHESVPVEAHRLRVLDGLRGIAILLVVLPHVEQAGLMSDLPRRVGSTSNFFAHGVEVFFVLSGFCLAYPLLVRRRDDGAASFDIAVFYLNRAWRIMPLYLGATILAVVAASVLTHLTRDSSLDVPPVSDVARSMLLLDRGTIFANATLWSVPVQLRWYLLFPLVLWAWMRAPRVVVALVPLAWIAYLGTRLHSLDVGALPLFLLGIIAADIFVRNDARRAWALPLIPVALVLAYFGNRFAVFPDPSGVDIHWTLQPTTIGWQLTAFLFVIAATSNAIVARIVAFAPLRALGVASFSIYLTHQAAIAFVASSPFPARGIVATILSIAVGFAVWAVLEHRLSAPDVRRAVRARLLPVAYRALDHLQLPHVVVFKGDAPPVQEPRTETVPHQIAV